MVGLMGGRLAVDSTPGAGSRFHFAIPLDADGELAAPLPDETHRVAIVDASEGRARALARLLRYHGIGSRPFPNFESARAETLPCDAWVADAGTIAGEAWRSAFGEGEFAPKLIVLSTQNAVKVGGDDAPPVVQRRYPVDARDLTEIIRAARDSVARKEMQRPAAPPRQSAPALRILIAEDNAVNRALIERMLGRLGQPAMVVNDGAAAVAAAAMQDFDLILMDLQMPVMDGFEATQVIRATERELHRRRVPIHALTADTLPGDRQRCIDAGMDGHLSKPLSLTDLQKLLDSLRSSELAKAS
jgi:CheY-like chemotaxis protein